MDSVLTAPTVNDIHKFRAVFRGIPIGENQLMVKISSDIPVELRRDKAALNKWRAFDPRTGQAYGVIRGNYRRCQEAARGLFLRVVQDWQAFDKDGNPIERAVWDNGIPF